jgi:uncharacterized protein (TIGR00255 family)
MTGYGKQIIELPAKKITIEIKSLNSKTLDINTKISNGYKVKEFEIRSETGKILERGKIDLSLSSENTSDILPYSLNKNLARKYYQELKALSDELGENDFSDFLPIILKMPDVLVTEKEDVDESEWDAIRQCLLDTLNQLDEFRILEGELLKKDIVNRINLILELLKDVEPFEIQRITLLKNRLHKSLGDITEEVKIDENRFEQEIIYYLEKLDITEEKVRLKKHCDYFLESLEEPVSQGKKLSFITQEIGREINTLGSKANEVNIQKIVVRMKDELEKIKEQLANIL